MLAELLLIVFVRIGCLSLAGIVMVPRSTFVQIGCLLLITFVEALLIVLLRLHPGHLRHEVRGCGHWRFQPGHLRHEARGGAHSCYGVDLRSPPGRVTGSC
eukprot:gnl/TRDRNA2_/TRDRNA2_164668_c0_seq2.p2 gnl/TRDRNA2_/TRDRNA2_164668_c0~~gnl/TRDRNA2_/TRDRNA2_164668_c0_seq2.p2  ORF type:complete len:101 (-),score=14.99 gnl/TRDRNA2_/TRDRNA2_164668_c0_seq2:332-634(-)